MVTGQCTSVSGGEPLASRWAQQTKRWRKQESGGVGLGIIVASLDLNVSGSMVVGSPRTVRISGCLETSDGRCDKKMCDGEGGVGFLGASPASSPSITGGSSELPVVDFLDYCYLCRKRLHGKDIYMYRGEKAFCSMECRCEQIVREECQEICRSTKPSDGSSTSAYSTGGHLFFTGIAVA